ncbi:unnamed protein product [Acidithrix sp. C25]|nr:unnamed protein product [Acidithrix sp. C25]
MSTLPCEAPTFLKHNNARDYPVNSALDTLVRDFLYFVEALILYFYHWYKDLERCEVDSSIDLSQKQLWIFLGT